MNSQYTKLFLPAVIGGVIMFTSTTASAGFMDTFNRAAQSVQQTTSTIENTQRTVERAGSMVKPKRTLTTKPVEEAPARLTSGSLTAKDKAAIEKAKRAWVAAFKAEDWDALVDQYAENAIIFPPDEDMKSGHDAIRANFDTGEDTSNEVFETTEINGDDHIAYVQGKFSFTISSDNNPPVKAAGKYIEIWEKQADGSWLIINDIWNASPVK